MKKVLSILLTALILVSLFTVLPVFAKQPVELKLTDTTVYAGEEFEVRLFISDNSKLSGAVIDLKYDSTMLEYVSGTKGAIIDDGAIVSINDTDDSSDLRCVRFTYLSPSASVTSEGVLFSIKFKALPNAEGESNITISIPSAGDFVNDNAEKLSYTLNDATVKIINTTVESTEKTENTTDDITTDSVETTDVVTEASISDDIDDSNNDNVYIKIVIGLFVSGGLIIFGVVLYMIVKKKMR